MSTPARLQAAQATLEDRPEQARPAPHTEEELTTPSPDRIANILWPVPVFERLRETQSVVAGGIELRPGDVLETLDASHCESLLVISVLPDAIARNPTQSADARPHLLTYSDEFQTFRVINAGMLYGDDTEDRVLRASDGTASMPYYVHGNAADLVKTSTQHRADRTYQRDDAVAPPLLSLRDQFPESFQREIRSPPPESPPEGRSIDDVVGEIFNEDARTFLSSLPNNSVHTAITSPPYYEMRDYNVSGQLGHERTAKDYIESLLGIINHLGDVVRDDGTIWLVIDDSRLSGHVRGLPELLHREVQNQGYDVIHHSPWVKTNGGKPDPAPNRFADTHERILCLTSSAGDHYFNRREADDTQDVFEVPVGQTQTEHDAVFPLALPKKILKAATPEKVCADCGAPHEPVYEVTNIRDLPTGRQQASRALELADEHDLTDDHLEALRAVGLGGTGQSARVQSGTGNNRESVESLAAEAREVLGSYAREFTTPNKTRTGWKQTCSCNCSETEPGIAVDPFTGSGTTLAAAKQLQYRWTGTDINEQYVARAQKRLRTTVDEPERLTAEEQATLEAWE